MIDKYAETQPDDDRQTKSWTIRLLNISNILINS